MERKWKSPIKHNPCCSTNQTWNLNWSCNTNQTASRLNSQSVPVELNWKLVPKEPNCREVFLQPNSVLQPMNIIPDSSVHDENQNSDILESADDFDQMESTMENTNEKCSEDEKSYFHLGCFIIQAHPLEPFRSRSDKTVQVHHRPFFHPTGFPTET